MGHIRDKGAVGQSVAWCPERNALSAHPPAPGRTSRPRTMPASARTCPRDRHARSRRRCAARRRPRVTLSARQRSRSPRSRLRKRATLSSGRRRWPRPNLSPLCLRGPACSSKPRKAVGSEVRMTVLRGCSRSRRPSMLRFEERRLSGLLFQEPPRTTREDGTVQAPGVSTRPARGRRRRQNAAFGITKRSRASEVHPIGRFMHRKKMRSAFGGSDSGCGPDRASSQGRKVVNIKGVRAFRQERVHAPPGSR